MFHAATHLLDRQILVPGIHVDRHDGAATQGRGQIVIGVGPLVAAAARCRFVGEQFVFTGPNPAQELIVGSSFDEHVFGCLGPVDFEKAACPGGDHAGGIVCVFAAAEEVVGPIEADETLGMSGRREDALRVIDRYDPVHGRVHDQQCPTEAAEPLVEVVRAGVGDEIVANPEAAPGQVDFGAALFSDRVEVFVENA